jgi:hypothetical protein
VFSWAGRAVLMSRITPEQPRLAVARPRASSGAADVGGM